MHKNVSARGVDKTLTRAKKMKKKREEECDAEV